MVTSTLFSTYSYSIFRGANGEKDAFRRNPSAPECAHLKYVFHPASCSAHGQQCNEWQWCNVSAMRALLWAQLRLTVEITIIC